MKVIIIRHGRVDYCWKEKYTSNDFDKACSQYDKAPIMRMSYDIPSLDIRQIYISTLDRSRDTAIDIFGNKNFVITKLVSEVPLGSSFDTKIKLPLWFWNVTGRIQWLFNSRRQFESRKNTKMRARRFVELLSSVESDSAVVSHGFYMYTLVKEMRKEGFRIIKSQKSYKNGGYVIMEDSK